MVPTLHDGRLNVSMPRPWLAFWRIGFGLIWLVDAWFKWQPSFVNGFVSYLSGNISTSQPAWVDAWIHFWVETVKVDPKLFAYLVALGEIVIALALLRGVGVRLFAVLGSALSLIIWSTGEAFGGPYTTGVTDIGAAIIYVGGFALLALTQCGYAFGLDGRLGLNGWSWRRVQATEGQGAVPRDGPA
jgi:uncharacterized membrane protein YphA (DoxX/SURF4 family)